MEKIKVVEGKFTEVCGVEVPKITGGFGDNKKAMLAKHIAEIHGKKVLKVNEAINKNRKRFRDNIDIIDIKSNPEFAIHLVDNNIMTNMQVSKAKHIYLLSERGYAKLIKIFGDDKSWEVYDQLLDEYFDLQEENKRLGQVNNELHKIAVSDDDQKEREYQANKVKYSWKNIRTVLEDCTYKNIEDEVHNVINFHTDNLKKKDRANYPSHQEANKTEYKQIVRDRVYEVLTNIYNSTLDASLRTISSQVKEDVLLDKIGTINRSNSKKLSGIKEVYISDKPSDDQYIKLDTHGFSHNHQYEYDVWDDKWVRTEAYDRWLSKFPLYQLPDKDYWNVDWEEPIEIFIQYIAKPEVDIRNLDKSIIDKVFSVYCEDDNIVDEVHSKRIGDCHKYSDGEIRLFIKNVAAQEVAS